MEKTAKKRKKIEQIPEAQKHGYLRSHRRLGYRARFSLDTRPFVFVSTAVLNVAGLASFCVCLCALSTENKAVCVTSDARVTIL